MDANNLHQENPLAGYCAQAGQQPTRRAVNAIISKQELVDKVAKKIKETELSPMEIGNKVKNLNGKQVKEVAKVSGKLGMKNVAPTVLTTVAGGVMGTALGGPPLGVVGAGLGLSFGVARTGAFVGSDAIRELQKQTTPENPYNDWFSRCLDEAQKELLVGLIRRRREFQSLLDVMGGGKIRDPYVIRNQGNESASDLAKRALEICFERRRTEFRRTECLKFFEHFSKDFQDQFLLDLHEENPEIVPLEGPIDDATKLRDGYLRFHHAEPSRTGEFLRENAVRYIGDLFEDLSMRERGIDQLVLSYLKTFTSYTPTECEEVKNNILFFVKAKTGRMLSLKAIRNEIDGEKERIETFREEDFRKSPITFSTIIRNCLRVIFHARGRRQGDQESLLTTAIKFMVRGICFIEKNKLMEKTREEGIRLRKGKIGFIDYQRNVQLHYNESGYRYVEDALVENAPANLEPNLSASERAKAALNQSTVLTDEEKAAMERLGVKTDFHLKKNRGMLPNISNKIVKKFA